MKAIRFIKIVVLVPLATLGCVWLFNAIVDPFGTSSLSPLDYDRYPVAMDTNPWMYKAARIHEAKAPIAIFGDSTIGRIDPALILPLARDAVANFAVPGDALDDSFDVIDYALKDYGERDHHLTRVVLGASVYRFVEGSKPRLFARNAAIIDQPFGRYLNLQMVTASLADLRAMIAPAPNVQTSSEKAAKLEGQKHTVLTAMRLGRNSVDRPAQLRALACSLQRRGIALTILVPPYSATLDDEIDAAFPDARPRFNAWLRTMPHVLDYDGPGKFAAGENYIDLLHLKYDRARVLLEDMLLERPKLAAEYRNPRACDGWSPSTDGAARSRALMSRIE